MVTVYMTPGYPSRVSIVRHTETEDPRYRLAYNEAVRKIETQERDLAELRGRTAGVLTIAVAITAFLGGFVLNRHNPGIVAEAGIAAFAAVVLSLAYVLRPQRGWKFLLSGRTLVEGWVEDKHPASSVEMLRGLALLLSDNADHNEAKMGRLMWAFEAALVFLGVDTALWLIALAVSPAPH
jgi:hypothetical protein